MSIMKVMKYNVKAGYTERVRYSHLTHKSRHYGTSGIIAINTNGACVLMLRS